MDCSWDSVAPDRLFSSSLRTNYTAAGWIMYNVHTSNGTQMKIYPLPFARKIENLSPEFRVLCRRYFKSVLLFSARSSKHSSGCCGIAFSMPVLWLHIGYTNTLQADNDANVSTENASKRPVVVWGIQRAQSFHSVIRKIEIYFPVAFLLIHSHSNFSSLLEKC